ncbi:cyclophilin-like fold protein [Actinomyces trachealis]|uniref:cyclophilin-like fold protein n=1 Tax=Actinomyces trachealis TaxID=2763540 RepID=UPI001892A43A|nr:cyclophilin-like fold protein [Actinomyces trachealis]
MIISVNGHDLELQLADNPSAHAFADLVTGGNLELNMEDYGGFEKVGVLPQRLPTSDEQITTRPGDVVLYQGDQLAIYYHTNTWSLTRIGRITDVYGDQLHQVLGDGDVTVAIRGE